MKKNILKSLFLSVLMVLCATNAWAGDKTVVKYSFDDANSPSLTAGSRVRFDYDKTSVITSTKFLNAWNNENGDPGASTISLGSTDLSGETWTLSFEWAAVGGCNKKPDHTTLKTGDTTLFDFTGNSNWNTEVTITYTGSDGTKTLPVPGCNKSYRFTAGTGNQLNTTDYWHHVVVTGGADGVKLTITNSSTGTAVVEDVLLSETNVNPTGLVIEPCCGGAIGIDELSLNYYVAGEVIQTPMAAYTAVDGINRTITATCDTEGATLYYSTDGENWTEGATVVVSETGNVYFKAVKGSSESDVLTFAAVAGEAIVLNTPLINRTSNTSVTITADQTNLLLSPTATIYYTYGEENGSFTGSKTLTVAADATITAYAEATGYTTSETAELAVALFPTYVNLVENTPCKTSGWSSNAFSEETKTVSERTYAALLLDDTQWGQNVYFQTDGAWGFRASGNWYINSDTQESWILMPGMKQGDIIVVDASYPASSTVNATYSKYAFGTKYAYEVTEDGDVEIALKKINAATMDYLYGIYSYTAMSEAEIAFADAKAELQAAITDAKAIDTTDKQGAEELAAAITAAEEALAAEGATTESLTAAKAALAEAVAAFNFANFDLATAIVNADFTADEPVAKKICTYAKDVTEGDVANMQPLTGWTIVENGDARAAGTFAYNSKAILGGAGGEVPAAGPNGETEGKVLGIEAVWSATTQYTQEVKLPAGEYLFEAVVYNAGGTGALSQNLIGIDGTYCATKSYPVGKWTKDQVKITLTEEKAVTVSLGANSGNVGNAAAPHLFIDHVKLYGSEEIAAIELAAAKENALAEVNALTIGEGLFAYSEAAVTTAKNAIESATTIEEVNAALAAVKAAQNKPAEDKAYAIANTTATGNLSITTEKVTVAKDAYVFFTAVDGGYVLSNKDGEYILKTAGNAWTLSTTTTKEDAYVVNFNLADGAYTIQGANGLFGLDSTDEGSTVYADKTKDKNGLWTIAEFVPVTYAYGTIWENGTVTTEGDYQLIALSTDIFKAIAKENDTLCVNMTDVAKATARAESPLRTLKQGNIALIDGLTDANQLFSATGLKADVEKIDIVLTADMLAKINAVENIYLRYQNLTVTKVDLTEYKSPVDPAVTAALEALQAEIDAAEALLKDETKTEGRDELTAAIAAAKEKLASTDVAEINAATDALKAAEEAFEQANFKGFTYQKYIVQNVASKKFWGAGNSWGTQASLVEHPEYIKFNPLPNGKYKLESQVNNGGEQYYFNGDYMDNGSPVELTITEVSDGKYTIANGENYYGWDGTSTVLGKNLAADSENALWTIVSLADAKAALANATADAPMDATLLIEDHDFGRNNRYANKWTIEASNKNLSGGNNTNNCAESYHSVFTLSQVLEGAPKGIYALTAQGFYRQDVEGEFELPYFYANDEKQNFPLKTGAENSMSDASNSFSNGLYTIDPIYVEVAEDGTLTIGAKSETENFWCIWDNFVLTYYGATASIDEVKNGAIVKELAELRAKAQELLANVEIDAVKNAINEALTATANVTGADAINEAIATMKAVIEKAEASIIAKDILPKMKQLTEETNVYTQEAYEEYYGQWVVKYEGGELTKAEAASLQNPFVVTGWHASITCDNFLLSAWDTNPDFQDAAYYINSWSTEGENDGSNFKVPFFEYWTGDGNSLGEKTLTATMNGLQKGNYDVNAWVRVRIKNDAAAPAYGITMQTNNGEAVDVTGEQVGTSQMYLKEVTTTGEVGEDGVLKIKFNVAADNNISWLSFKNVKYEFKSPVGINNINAEKMLDGTVYNLNGQKVQKAQKGLYIINGKKVVLK